MTEPAGTTTDAPVDPGTSRVAVPPKGDSTPGSKEDWTDQVTGLIVDNVDKVRNKTTGPILEVTRGSVHAVVAVTLLVPVVVIFTILTVRVLTYYVFREVWITYAVIGMVFTLVGVVLWSRRHPSTTRT